MLCSVWCVCGGGENVNKLPFLCVCVCGDAFFFFLPFLTSFFLGGGRNGGVNL